MDRCFVSSIHCQEHTPMSSPRAINVGHSQLLQSPTSPQAILDVDKEKDLLDARRKFSSCLESAVLDYLHYHPSQLEDCVTTLHRLFSNIVEHPEDPKYRRIKAANKAYLKHVASVKHAEDLMLQAGWRPKVVEMEKSWVWDHDAGSHEFRVLCESTEVLQKSMTTLHAKAERLRKENEERRGKHAEERERVRLALEDDRRQRLLAQELTGPRPHTHPTSRTAD